MRVTCHSCEQLFPESQATPWEPQSGRRTLYHCPPCVSDMAPGLVRFQHDRERTDSHLRKLYGIGVEDYESLYRFQAGKCSICERRPTKERRLVVDHDHATGEVRGLLCGRCNLALGALEDRKDWLNRARSYLKKPPTACASRVGWSVDDHIAERIAEREAKQLADKT